jgi:glycerol-3-phosphate acyltransferase PlsY
MIGTIPSGPIICSLLALKDPMSYGSKNTGATNVARQDVNAGLLTLIFDFMKGFLPIILLNLDTYSMCVIVAGHCFSPFLKFRGGKGVATGLGALLACSPASALGALACFILGYSVSQNVGFSSIFACTALAGYSMITLDIGLLICSLLILRRHRDNFNQLYYRQIWNLA